MLDIKRAAKIILPAGIMLAAVQLSAYAAENTVLDKAADALAIPYCDDIRGNITLLPSVKVGDESVAVTWSSSNPDIITDKDIPIDDIGIEEYKTIPAGVVTRQDEDTNVTLTAVLEYNGETKTKIFNAAVKAKPEQKETTAYAFSSFPSNHEEQVYLSIGKDPLHFKDLNGGQPILKSNVGNQGIRDPYIIRSHDGDRFYLLSTDLKAEVQGFQDNATLTGSKYMVIWQSDDLANWSDAQLTDCGALAYMANTGYHLGCVYAPEAIYDDVTGEYVVYWASRWYPYYTEENGNKSGRKYKIFYSKTRDFVNFTDAQLYMDYNGTGVGAIDMTMIKASDDKYYRISADGAMNIQTSDYVLGEWKTISDITSLHLKMNGYDKFKDDYLNADGETLELTGGLIEGPELFKFNGEERYGLYADNYQLPGFGYIPTTTTDLSDTSGDKWQLYTRDQYSWGTQRKRHGGILPITAEEYDRLAEKYGVEN